MQQGGCRTCHILVLVEIFFLPHPFTEGIILPECQQNIGVLVTNPELVLDVRAHSSAVHVVSETQGFILAAQSEPLGRVLGNVESWPFPESADQSLHFDEIPGAPCTKELEKHWTR
jgi:hypothetical protein